jgi:hypothetical protein
MFLFLKKNFNRPRVIHSFFFKKARLSFFLLGQTHGLNFFEAKACGPGLASQSALRSFFENHAYMGFICLALKLIIYIFEKLSIIVEDSEVIKEMKIKSLISFP